MRRRKTVEPDDEIGTGMVIINCFPLSIPESERANCFRFSRQLLETARFAFPEIVTNVLSRLGPAALAADFVHHSLAMFSLKEDEREGLSPEDYKKVLARIQGCSPEFIFWTCDTLRDYTIERPTEISEWLEARGKNEIEAYSIETEDESILGCFVEQVLSQHPSFCRPNLVVTALYDLGPKEHLTRVLAMVNDKRDKQLPYLEPISLQTREENLAKLSFKDLLVRFKDDKNPLRIRFS